MTETAYYWETIEGMPQKLRDFIAFAAIRSEDPWLPEELRNLWRDRETAARTALTWIEQLQSI